MTIGIIGGDDRAVAIGRLFKRCGHTVTFSDPTPAHTAQHAAEALGDDARATTAYQQSARCEALVLAVHWEEIDTALAALGDYKDGLLIDATRPPFLEGTSGAQLLAHKLDNRHIVKAFVDNLEPGCPVRVASDDPVARATVKTTISTCGRLIEDYGPLARASEIERDYAANAA